MQVNLIHFWRITHNYYISKSEIESTDITFNKNLIVNSSYNFPFLLYFDLPA